MFKLLLMSFTLIIATGFIGLTDCYSQNIPAKGQKKVDKCGISFIIPKNLKDKKVQGIDSCVAEFKNKTMQLSMEYGSHTSIPEDYIKHFTKKELLEIDGKKATLITEVYNYAQYSSRNTAFSSYLYIVVSESEFGKNALNIIISSKKQSDLDTAKQIFQSIRFTTSI